MSARGSLLRRAAIGALLFITLAGPTPGAVGSCGGDTLDQAADLESYCKERDQLICVRRALRHEISNVVRDECRRDAIDACERRFWAPGCQPTERQARACLNALRSLDNLETKEDELDECDSAALCGGRPDIGDAGGS